MPKSTAFLALFTVLLAGCPPTAEEEARTYHDGSDPGQEEIPSSVTWDGPVPEDGPPPVETDAGGGQAGGSGAGGGDAASPPSEDAQAPPQIDAGPPPPDAAPEPDAGPEPCVYPSGPYGSTLGSVVPSYATWIGYRPGDGAPKTVTADDFYDCDGSRGIHAVYLDYVAGWCSACQSAAWDLANKAAQWKSHGVVVVSLIIETSNYNPASVSTAEWWRDQFDLQDTYVLADPDQQIFSGDFLPYEVLVDPRTMKIVGAGELTDSQVLSLAQQNQ